MTPVFLIPAYNPDRRLVDIVVRLAAAGAPVVVVADGSEPGRRPVFEALDPIAGVTVLRRGTNRGHGAALHTRLAPYLDPTAAGERVVTRDAHGHPVLGHSAPFECHIRPPPPTTRSEKGD